MRWPGGDLPEIVADLFGARAIACSVVSGGSINDAYRVRLDNGTSVFVKSQRDPLPRMFECEAAGLRWLAETNTARVPRVLHFRDGNELHHRFLVLEWIEPGQPAPDHDEQLGRSLASLHRFGCARFGFDEDNYLATLPQANEPTETWAAFYGHRRIGPLMRLAVDGHRLPANCVGSFDRLYERLDDLVGPDEPPARLHGDLWSGNVITGADGQAVLLDPAVYGGHREVDLAMMRLFGGFGARTFAAYEETFPLAEGHHDRLLLYQLYPLLAHVNLFGGAYVEQTMAALHRLV